MGGNFSKSAVGEPSLVGSSVNDAGSSSYMGGHEIAAKDRRKALLELLKRMVPPSRVEFLKIALSGTLNKENVELTQKARRESSMRQYDSAWFRFCRWLRTFKINEINTNTVVSYLRHLLKVGDLKYSTIKAHRSSLVEPLEAGFNVSWDNRWFKITTKALKNTKPSRPINKISWSLEKTLDAIKQKKHFKLN